MRAMKGKANRYQRESWERARRSLNVKTEARKGRLRLGSTG